MAMEEAGSVRGDSTTFQGYVDQVSAKFTDLNAHWEGYSYNTIKGKVDSLVGKKSIIVTQLEIFANICEQYDKYKTNGEIYKTAKTNKEIAEYNFALAETEADRAHWQGEVEKYEKQMKEAKEAMQAAADKALAEDGRPGYLDTVDAPGDSVAE